MNPDELRIKIYEHLGLEVGSLASEGGNDWVRAEKEVLAGYRQEQAEKNSTIQKIDYRNIDKSSQEFISVINSNSVKDQGYNSLIATRNDLSENDILLLIQNASKETMMNLARYQKLSDEQIGLIIPNSVYLTKKFLIENQNLSDRHKEKLLILMKNFNSSYTDIISSIS